MLFMSRDEEVGQFLALHAIQHFERRLLFKVRSCFVLLQYTAYVSYDLPNLYWSTPATVSSISSGGSASCVAGKFDVSKRPGLPRAR